MRPGPRCWRTCWDAWPGAFPAGDPAVLHRLQYLLSRAVWDDQQVADIASAWAVSYLDDGDAVQLAGSLIDYAQSLGIRATFVADDEVYGGRELRRSIRERGMGYVLAVRAIHTLTTGSGRT